MKIGRIILKLGTIVLITIIIIINPNSLSNNVNVSTQTQTTIQDKHKKNLLGLITKANNYKNLPLHTRNPSLIILP
jgi:hypothetical protein